MAVHVFIEKVPEGAFPGLDTGLRDNTKASILAAFKTRLNNDTETEFATACGQVERIALHRLKDLLP